MIEIGAHPAENGMPRGGSYSSFTMSTPKVCFRARARELQAERALKLTRFRLSNSVRWLFDSVSAARRHCLPSAGFPVLVRSTTPNFSIDICISFYGEV